MRMQSIRVLKDLGAGLTLHFEFTGIPWRVGKLEIDWTRLEQCLENGDRHGPIT